MERRGVTPDVVSYGSVIDACAKSQRTPVADAMDLFAKMRAKGIVPNEVGVVVMGETTE